MTPAERRLLLLIARLLRRHAGHSLSTQEDVSLANLIVQVDIEHRGYPKKEQRTGDETT